MKRLDLGDLASARDLFAEDLVWHYFNPELPAVQGDYVRLDGIHSLVEAIDGKTRGKRVRLTGGFEAAPASLAMKSPTGSARRKAAPRKAAPLKYHRCGAVTIRIFQLADAMMVCGLA